MSHHILDCYGTALNGTSVGIYNGLQQDSNLGIAWERQDHLRNKTTSEIRPPIIKTSLWMTKHKHPM